MGMWLSWVKSNEKQLLTILDNLAIKAVETSEALVVLFSDLKNKEYPKKIHDLEREADVLTRDIFSELNKTFITPLDREDMQRIASKIDDVIDFMDGIAARICSYHITEPPPYSQEIPHYRTSSIFSRNGKGACKSYKRSSIHGIKVTTYQKSSRYDRPLSKY
jgi:uncharacterized protein Yka (UPF0111/DUF47 family)